MIFLAVLTLAVVLPSLGTRSTGPSAAGLVVVCADELGTRNEAAFPGGRSEPLPGEAVYWAWLAVLVLLSGLIARMSKP